jgi:hypothetical protein
MLFIRYAILILIIGNSTSLLSQEIRSYYQKEDRLDQRVLREKAEAEKQLQHDRSLRPDGVTDRFRFEGENDQPTLSIKSWRK